MKWRGRQSNAAASSAIYPREVGVAKAFAEIAVAAVDKLMVQGRIVGFGGTRRRRIDELPKRGISMTSRDGI